MSWYKRVDAISAYAMVVVVCARSFALDFLVPIKFSQDYVFVGSPYTNGQWIVPATNTLVPSYLHESNDCFVPERSVCDP